jgi:hypothetical protein
MKVFFIEGGIVFMGILTLLFLLIIGLSILAGISIFRGTNGNSGKARKLLDHIKSVALFTLVFAVFSQILGLVDVFDYLANKDSSVASSIIAKGIKLTFHPTLYGLIIYLVSILISPGLKSRIHRIEVSI